MISEAFNALNPPETWNEGIVRCPTCNADVSVRVPQEVRATEWPCKLCHTMLSVYIEDGKPTIKWDRRS